jgi:hypothetical protein
MKAADDERRPMITIAAREPRAGMNNSFIAEQVVHPSVNNSLPSTIDPSVGARLLICDGRSGHRAACTRGTTNEVGLRT